jgi:hypothetical protein
MDRCRLIKVKNRGTVEGLLSVRKVIIFKKTTENNRIADNPAPQPHATAQRRGVCVNASVVSNFLYIHK